MAAKIFNPPEGFEPPKTDWRNYNRKEEQKKEEDYIERLRQWHFDNGFKGKYVGEVIKFQVADGHALYMVSKLRPLELIHIPLGDAYSFHYEHLLTAKEVKENIRRQKALEKIFGKKEEGK